MKVHFLNLKKDIVSGEPYDGLSIGLFKKIKTSTGDVYVPKSMKLWENKSELIAFEIAQWYKSGSDVQAAFEKFNISEEEGKKHLEIALNKFPELFI